MASEDVQTNLRLPADLKDRLVASAAASKRSLSAEVASRLEASYAGGGVGITDPVMQRVKTLAERANIAESEALERLALQGWATLENRNVLIVRADAGATMDDLILVMKAAKNFVPDVSDVHFERDM